MSKSGHHYQFSEKISVLWLSSLLQEDLFQQPGLRVEFEHIRDCLDTGMIDNLCILQESVCACETMGAVRKERKKTLKAQSLLSYPQLTVLLTQNPLREDIAAVSSQCSRSLGEPESPDKQHGPLEMWAGILALRTAWQSRQHF